MQLLAIVKQHFQKTRFSLNLSQNTKHILKSNLK